MNSDALQFDKLLALAKNRGFVFAGSEIYGGLANAWDYGPLGVSLSRKIKDLWWKSFVTRSKHNVGLDSAILMNSEVWVASGHVGGFNDPLLDCRSCKKRYRADQLIEEHFQSKGESFSADGLAINDLESVIAEHKICCPSCDAHDFTAIRQFNLMFHLPQGKTEDDRADLYLRPETAQGIFVNFANVQRSTRRKLPFGIAQMGKSFRNEITPKNFIFRTREFEQMELEFFCKPDTDLEWFSYWRQFCYDFLTRYGLSESNLRFHDHSAKELSFYSKATTDIQYQFPFGWGELWGVADRTDYDLGRHMDHAKTDLRYFDPYTNEKYIPYVIEPSVGVGRLFLAYLCEAYHEDVLENGETRTVMQFHPALAPVEVAVLPLSSKLSEQAEQICDNLREHFDVEFDDRQSIGKRYRRQDEIGTPYCVTVDFETVNDNAVTVRKRDEMTQERINLSHLVKYIQTDIVALGNKYASNLQSNKS